MKLIAINGFGTIGKRIFDAIELQDDMKVIGISKIHPDANVKHTFENKNLDIYIPNIKNENQERMRKSLRIWQEKHLLLREICQNLQTERSLCSL